MLLLVAQLQGTELAYTGPFKQLQPQGTGSCTRDHSLLSKSSDGVAGCGKPALVMRIRFAPAMRVLLNYRSLQAQVVTPARSEIYNGFSHGGK